MSGSADQYIKESLSYLTKGTQGLEKGLNELKKQLPKMSKEDQEQVNQMMEDMNIVGMSEELKEKIKIIKQGHASMDRRG